MIFLSFSKLVLSQNNPEIEYIEHREKIKMVFKLNKTITSRLAKVSDCCNLELLKFAPIHGSGKSLPQQAISFGVLPFGENLYFAVEGIDFIGFTTDRTDYPSEYFVHHNITEGTSRVLVHQIKPQPKNGQTQYVLANPQDCVIGWLKKNFTQQIFSRPEIY